MKKYFIIILVSLCAVQVSAQNPNWSFDVNNYQFSMTLTTTLNVNGVTLSSQNDRVAAFINGEVRGVAEVTYVASANKYVAYLLVYANSGSKTVSFKLYDSTNDTVVDITKTINFTIDGNIGSVFQSLSLAEPALNSVATINAFSFANVTEKSITIGSDKIAVLLPSATAISSLIANFTVSNGAKVFVNNVVQTSGVTVNNFTNAILYQVLSEDESTLKTYEVVVDVAEAIADLSLNLTTASNTLIRQNPVVIQLKTSEALAALNFDDFQFTNAALQTITKVDATTYTLNLVALSAGDFSIFLPENSVFTQNAVGNNASNRLSFTYDAKSPFLVSVLQKTPSATITNSNQLAFTVTFNEAVTNVKATDFETISEANLSLQKINDAVYTVFIDGIENYNGSISINLKASNDIKDLAGNPLRLSIFKSY